MKRHVSRAIQAAIDLTVLSAAYTLAFSLRFDCDLSLQALKRALSANLNELHRFADVGFVS